MPEHHLSRLTEAISLAIRSLGAMQKESGEFPTFWSRTLDMREPTYAESPFVTGMILLALSALGGKEAAGIRRRGCEYLRTKRRPNGYFAFLDKGIDPDLDDTCLLNWALQWHQRHDSSGFRELARRVACLPKQDGIYATWMREDENAGNDFDPCVSVNVIRFLDGNRIASPTTAQAVRHWMRRDAGRQGTLYYESPLALCYLVFTLPSKPREAVLGRDWKAGWLAHRLAGATSSGVLSPIDAAMRLSVLCSYGLAPAALGEFAVPVLERQSPRGCWPSFAAYRAFNYWGSAALTTALSLQALAQYRTLAGRQAAKLAD